MCHSLHACGIALDALPPDAPASEHELIERARAGDEDAFARLVLAHADRVYGAVCRFGLDAGEADDVTQEVFLRAWRGLARFEERAQLSTWLYRIAFNEAQRRLSRRELPQAEPSLEGEDPVQAILDFANSGGFTQLFIGHSQRSGLWSGIWGNPVDKLLGGSHGMDVRVFPQ